MTTTSGNEIQVWVRLVRPRQWAKNALVFAAPLAAGSLLVPSVLGPTLLAAVIFSVAASAMYVLNDLVDRERDQVHPQKRVRPIATGQVSARAAMCLTAGLAALAIATSAIVSVALLCVVSAYVVITTLYSVRLKHLPVIDIVAVSSGFVLRAIAGGVASDVAISSWFLIVTSFGALFVVAGKRYGELVTLNDGAVSHRPSLNGYTREYLRYVLAFSSGLAAIAYCLWAFEVSRIADSQVLMELSILPFVTALLRYGHIVMQGRGGEPEELFLRDRELLVLGLLWLSLFGVGVSLA